MQHQIKVSIRERNSTNNKIALDLAFRPAIISKSGKPKRSESLRLYLIPNAKSAKEKEANRQTNLMAERMRIAAEIRLNKSAEDLKREEIAKTDFIRWIRLNIENERGAQTLIEYLHQYAGKRIAFGEIDFEFCLGFKDFLGDMQHHITGEPLKPNTLHHYFRIFKSIIRKAWDHGLLAINHCEKIRNYKGEEVQMQYLTKDELQRLANTPCASDNVRRAALFSALTGLRYSDILKLQWSEVLPDGRLYFRQKKTRAVEMLPVPVDAEILMGKRGTGFVFSGISRATTVNDILKDWIAAAGIDKHITFHCMRHTNASLLLAGGVDLYTVQRMLGHKNITTTQRYAKVSDEAKRKAANTLTLQL